MSSQYKTLGPITYIPPLPSSPSPPPSKKATKIPTIICLHGFDSSSLEYRRLHPLLTTHYPTYCADIKGWGFTDLSGSNAAATKTETMVEFVKSVCEQDGLEVENVIMCGASLGATVAMEVTLLK